MSRSSEHPLTVTRAIDDAHARLLAVRDALDDMARVRGHGHVPACDRCLGFAEIDIPCTVARHDGVRCELGAHWGPCPECC